MQLVTKRFGTIEVDDDNTLTVPHGIPGFPDLHRAVLLNASKVPGFESTDADHSLYWMQDAEHGDLAFLCVVPWGPFPHYDFEIDETDLGISDPTDVSVLNIITVRRYGQTAAMTVNLRAPLVIDVARQELHQVILADSRWPISTPLQAPPPTVASEPPAGEDPDEQAAAAPSASTTEVA